MFFKLIDPLIEHIKSDEGFADLTSFPLRKKNISALILLKNSTSVLSGIEIIELLYKYFRINFTTKYKDGDLIRNTTTPLIIGQVNGNAYDILLTERTILNVLSLMTSIATKTFNLQNRINALNVKTKIAGTRKILPQIGYLQKLAIMHGGGDTHRITLSDTILIKDNHLKLFKDIKSAIQNIKKNNSFSKKIEIEVENEEDALTALKEGVDIIMLDNFSSNKAKKVSGNLKNINSKIIIEVSGGINENNYLEFVDNNIDIISMGCLTTEIKYTDISLEISNHLM